MSSQNIHLYLTSEHACGYLPGRTATNLVPDPRVSMTNTLYSQLISLGYRRSGQFTYRPHCRECSACQPCRVAVDEFSPRRTQRRCLKANSDLDITVQPAFFSTELFDLYSRYINTRHADGEMVDPTPEDYRSFLYSDWSDTWFMQMRLDDELLSVMVFDRVEDGMSAVYSFFDPRLPTRSLGTFNVLQLIEHTRQLGLDYLYMGYMITDCDKMAYKAGFRPMQYFLDNRWVTEDPG